MTLTKKFFHRIAEVAGKSTLRLIALEALTHQDRTVRSNVGVQRFDQLGAIADSGAPAARRTASAVAANRPFAPVLRVHALPPDIVRALAS